MLFSVVARACAPDAILRTLPRIAIASFAAIISATAFAEGPLTLGEAQRLAVAHSRQLPAQDMAITALRDMAIAAGQLPDPVLKMGVDNLPVSGTDRFSVSNDFMTMRRIGIGQEWTRSAKRQRRSARYEHEADKSLAEKSATTAAIERDTAKAWLDRYYLEQIDGVIAEQAAQARLEIVAAESAYRAGRASQADVFLARGALAEVDDRSSDIQRRVRNAKTMLNRWTGTDSESSLAGIPNIDVIRLDPAALNSQLTHHPQIAVLSRQVDIADSEVKLAEENKNSDWSVEVAFQQRGPSYSNMVSIGVSVPLQWDHKNRQDRELASKLALFEQSKAERDEMLREHIADTEVMLDEWRSDRERNIRYEQELIPLANQRIQAVLAAYRGGKASLADLLGARRNEIDVRIQSLQLQADTARLWAQLNFLFPIDADGTHSNAPTGKDIQ